MKRYILLLGALAATPVSAEPFMARGAVTWVGSLGTVNQALLANVRDGDTDVLAGCKDGFAYLGESDAGFEGNRQRVMDSYFAGTRARFTIERDAAGGCHMTAIGPAA
jgi:hypothetical protein